MSGRDGGSADRSGAELRTALMDMEPDLRTVSGLLVACRMMGEAADHVEPQAIGAVARCAVEALDRVMDAWKAAIELDRDKPGNTLR